MASIVTSKFRIHNAEQFVESFSEASNTIMYLFIGKSTAFPDDNAHQRQLILLPTLNLLHGVKCMEQNV
jgi:hypothetical protein